MKSETTAPTAGLQPTSGARFVVDLETLEQGRARYVGAVYLPASVHPLRVDVDASGAVATIDGPDDVKALERQAAALIKAAAKLPRDDGEGPPPRRIVRWRG